jgi:putative endonuclease
MTCYVYMVLCKNGGLYCGVADDAIKRWQQHQSGIGARYIRIHGYEKPVYLEVLKDKSAAMKREREIKTFHKNTKAELISQPQNIIKQLNFT